jgi:predicted O-methyltransferase YrrM
MKTFLHFVRYVLGIDAPSTQVSEEERVVLVGLAQQAKVVVELGCFEGATTGVLARACDGVVHTVDPFHAGRFGVCWGKLIARINLRGVPSGRVQIHQMVSWRAASLVSGPVDLLFIDADHSLASVTKDWQAWFPRVAVGGVIALHDSLLAPNSQNRLGSTEFYETTVRSDDRVRTVLEVGCMAVLRKIR